MVVVALLGFGPIVVHEFWPAAARFVPPSLLLLFAAGTNFLALMVWRTDWLVRMLFADAVTPERLAEIKRESHRQRLSAAIGLFLAVFLIALWVKSLL